MQNHHRLHKHIRHSSFTERRHKQLIRESDASSSANINWEWVNYKGSWMTTLLVIVSLRVLFGIVPGVSAEVAWTLTNVVFNGVTFIMFHWLLGTPFDFNQGACDGLTLWEQIDNELQFTPAKKFFTAVPVALFLVSAHYTTYNSWTFFINVIVLGIILIAKHPSMHRVRLFGIHPIVND